jgi:hypothetical protein
VCRSVSLSGSRESAVNVTSRLALGEQLVEEVPSGHGNVIDAAEEETETEGSTFDGAGVVRALRCPTQN